MDKSHEYQFDADKIAQLEAENAALREQLNTYENRSRVGMGLEIEKLRKQLVAEHQELSRVLKECEAHCTEHREQQIQYINKSANQQAEIENLREHGQRYEQMFLDMLKVEEGLREQLAAAQMTIAEIPKDAIGKCLADLMDVYAKNGATSVSMPDECVAVAYWLSHPPTNQDAMHEALARECERLAGDGHLSIEGTAWLIEEAIEKENEQ